MTQQVEPIESRQPDVSQNQMTMVAAEVIKSCLNTFEGLTWESCQCKDLFEDLPQGPAASVQVELQGGPKSIAKVVQNRTPTSR